MSDALNTLIGKKRSQLITLNVRFFTIKVIQICTVESVFMMRTHNLVEHRASRVNVFFFDLCLGRGARDPTHAPRTPEGLNLLGAGAI